MPRAANILVVPCFNEERRLDREAFIELARSGRAGLLLVDDGSTDATLDVLHGIRSAASDCVDVLRLPRNSGKGEAVRRGLLWAVEHDASVVGYADADLSTPIAELLTLLEAAEHGVSVVLGCRVALLGMSVERRGSRRYLGRICRQTGLVASRQLTEGPVSAAPLAP